MELTVTLDIFSLAKKVALVTGGTGHLGSQFCIALAEAGAHVIIQGRDKAKVEKLVKKICHNGYSAEGAIVDLLDNKSLLNYFDRRKLDKLHILVNNAYSGVGGTILSSTDENYRESYEIGLVVVQKIFKICEPWLTKAYEEDSLASCINIASMYGIVVPDLGIYDSSKTTNPPFYGATKAALIHWTKYAAYEFGKKGIRINCISPGPFPNDMVQKNNPQFIAKLEKKVPLNRIGQAKELKGTILYLASNASSYVTGTNIKVDGGWTC
jgi:NAD(P)-dependent dehydrogenase (short-subunit alcohol dehydrogenase family)